MKTVTAATLILALSLDAACAHDVTSVKAPALDPPATVHVVNQTGQPDFSAWTIIIGADSGKSGVTLGGQIVSSSCLVSAQVPGERLFVEAAVMYHSPLDSLLVLHQVGDSARSPFADSLAKGLLTPAALLSSRPGLITATSAFDPAPPGYAPTDTVHWTWTATDSNPSTVVVDTADHTC